MLPFGIGIPEVLVILVVVLLVVGPSKLPELARTVGNGLRMARRAGSELRNALDFEEPINEAKRQWVETVIEDEVVAEESFDDCEDDEAEQTVSRGAATSSRAYLDNVGDYPDLPAEDAPSIQQPPTDEVPESEGSTVESKPHQSGDSEVI